MNTVLFLVIVLVASLVSTDALSCYCRRNEFGESTHCQAVEALTKSCQGGITDDVCFCCKTCAKVEGEWCGGLWDFDGHCDVGLFCDRGARREMYHVRGRCVRKGTTITKMEHTTADVPTTDSTEISSGDKPIESINPTEISTEDIQAIADPTYLDSEISSGDEATDATNPTERVIFGPSPTNPIELSSGDQATDATNPIEISSGEEATDATNPTEISSGDEATDATNPIEISSGDEATDATNPTERVIFGPSPANPIELSRGDQATDATNPIEISSGDEATDATNPTERVIFDPSPTNPIELSSGDEATDATNPTEISSGDEATDATNLIDQNIIV